MRVAVRAADVYARRGEISQVLRASRGSRRVSHRARRAGGVEIGVHDVHDKVAVQARGAQAVGVEVARARGARRGASQTLSASAIRVHFSSPVRCFQICGKHGGQVLLAVLFATPHRGGRAGIHPQAGRNFTRRVRARLEVAPARSLV